MEVMMWKAVLIIIMTSNTSPMSMMVGQFPDTFMSEVACESFIEVTIEDIDITIQIFNRYAKLGFEVINHEINCLEDSDGDPA
jgi:hypothetical protein